jgi:polyisoprenoid-binding protein YceI
VRRPVWASVLLVLSVLGYVQVQAEPVRWVVVPVKSFVVFEAGHPLGDFSGRADEFTGEVRLDPTDLKQGVSGALEVRARALHTGVNGRDRDMWRSLNADQHPQMRYTIEGVDASFASLTERSDITLTIRGTMRISGTERPMSFSGRARLRDERIWVRGESALRLTEFRIPPPSRLLFSVRDDVTLRFDLVLERGAQQ